jgi:hypothetical protein
MSGGRQTSVQGRLFCARLGREPQSRPPHGGKVRTFDLVVVVRKIGNLRDANARPQRDNCAVKRSTRQHGEIRHFYHRCIQPDVHVVR